MTIKSMAPGEKAFLGSTTLSSYHSETLEGRRATLIKDTHILPLGVSTVKKEAPVKPHYFLPV